VRMEGGTAAMRLDDPSEWDTSAPPNCIACGRFTRDGGRICARCQKGARRALREPLWLRFLRWLVR
jgi:hypothetical protein